MPTKSKPLSEALTALLEHPSTNSTEQGEFLRVVEHVDVLPVLEKYRKHEHPDLQWSAMTNRVLFAAHKSAQSAVQKQAKKDGKGLEFLGSFSDHTERAQQIALELASKRTPTKELSRFFALHPFAEFTDFIRVRLREVEQAWQDVREGDFPPTLASVCGFKDTDALWQALLLNSPEVEYTAEDLRLFAMSGWVHLLAALGCNGIARKLISYRFDMAGNDLDDALSWCCSDVLREELETGRTERSLTAYWRLTRIGKFDQTFDALLGDFSSVLELAGNSPARQPAKLDQVRGSRVVQDYFEILLRRPEIPRDPRILAQADHLTEAELYYLGALFGHDEAAIAIEDLLATRKCAATGPAICFSAGRREECLAAYADNRELANQHLLLPCLAQQGTLEHAEIALALGARPVTFRGHPHAPYDAIVSNLSSGGGNIEAIARRPKSDQVAIALQLLQAAPREGSFFPGPRAYAFEEMLAQELFFDDDSLLSEWAAHPDAVVRLYAECASRRIKPTQLPHPPHIPLFRGWRPGDVPREAPPGTDEAELRAILERSAGQFKQHLFADDPSEHA